jgi:hypothetical protein
MTSPSTELHPPHVDRVVGVREHLPRLDSRNAPMTRHPALYTSRARLKPAFNPDLKSIVVLGSNPDNSS